MKLPSRECHRTPLMMRRHQAIMWTRVDPDLCHHIMASLGHSESKALDYVFLAYICLSTCVFFSNYEFIFTWLFQYNLRYLWNHHKHNRNYIWVINSSISQNCYKCDSIHFFVLCFLNIFVVLIIHTYHIPLPPGLPCLPEALHGDPAYPPLPWLRRGFLWWLLQQTTARARERLGGRASAGVRQLLRVSNWYRYTRTYV